QINLSKSCVVPLGGTHLPRDQRIQFGDITLPVESKVRILGIIIDRYLKFDLHVKSVIERLTPVRNAFLRLCPNTYGLDSERRSILYEQVIRSALTYGCQVWSKRISSQSLSALQSFQLRSLRTVVSAYRTISYVSAETLAGVEAIDIYMERVRLEFEAKQTTPAGLNPLAKCFFPRATEQRRPK